MDEKYTAYFDRFTIELTEDDSQTGSHAGECYFDCKELTKQDSIKLQLDKIDPDSIRAELKGYGAWDKDELKDDEENRIRIVWIACGDVSEQLRAQK